MDRPDLIRSDNGGEFTAEAVREWLGELAEDPVHQVVHGRTGTTKSSGANCSTATFFGSWAEANYLIQQWRRGVQLVTL